MRATLAIDGTLFVPLECPPAWGMSYFYVVDDVSRLEDDFEPLRCLAIVGEPRGRRVDIDWAHESSVLSALWPPMDVGVGFVEPWQLRVGTRDFASLNMPAWCAFAPDIGQGSDSAAAGRVSDHALLEVRDYRLSVLDSPSRSDELIDDLQSLGPYRFRVLWCDRVGFVDAQQCDSGEQLVSALFESERRGTPHLIDLVDGRFSSIGCPWYEPVEPLLRQLEAAQAAGAGFAMRTSTREAGQVNEQEVIVDLRLMGGAFGSDGEQQRIFELEDNLITAIDAMGVGEYDGNEFGGGGVTLYAYGPNADALFAVMEPLIGQFAPSTGSTATLRYGRAANPAASERVVPLP